MDPTTQYSAATNIAKDTQSATANLFFDAAQVDTTPLEIGSDDLLQVSTANSPGGGGTVAGFDELTVVLAVDGAPVNRIILVKTPE
jgi:hypothetical protein